jgi:hypothetical protein
MTGHHTTHPVEAVAYFLQGRGRESGVVNHEFIFMPSPSSRSMAKPAAAWQLRYHFNF